MARVGSDAVSARRDPVDPSWVDSIDDGDDHTAAGLYLRAKRDANDRAMPAGSRQQAMRAMAKVHQRFPNAQRTAATAADHELGIDDDADLKRVRDQHRAEHGVTARGAAQSRRRGEHSSTGGGGGRAPARAGGAKGRSASTTRRPAAGARRRAPRAVRRIGQEAVRTSGAGGFADLAITTLGATIAFAVAYAVLSNAQTAPRGRAAVELFSKSVTSGVNLFLSPNVDPLAPRDPAAATVRRLQNTPSRPITTRTTRPGTGPARATP